MTKKEKVKTKKKIVKHIKPAEFSYRKLSRRSLKPSSESIKPETELLKVRKGVKPKVVKQITKKESKRKFIVELPKGIEKEDVKTYTTGRKLMVLDKNWKHVKEVVLPFFPDREVIMTNSAGKLLLKLRER